jgi:hypothetical protein
MIMCMTGLVVIDIVCFIIRFLFHDSLQVNITALNNQHIDTIELSRLSPSLISQ